VLFRFRKLDKSEILCYYWDRNKSKEKGMLVLWILVSYIVIGLIFASIMFRLTMRVVERGKLERYVPGEILSFIIETLLWPILLSIKLFFERRPKRH